MLRMSDQIMADDTKDDTDTDPHAGDHPIIIEHSWTTRATSHIFMVRNHIGSDQEY